MPGRDRSSRYYSRDMDRGSPSGSFEDIEASWSRKPQQYEARRKKEKARKNSMACYHVVVMVLLFILTAGMAYLVYNGTDTSAFLKNGAASPSNLAASPCSQDTCLNGGTCVKETGRCNCLEGWTGEICETKLYCWSNPCDNNGLCLDGANGYICFCRNGWAGDQCEEDIDECRQAVNPCGGNNACINTEGSYNCTCPDGYEGNKCEDIDECLSTPYPCGDNTACTNTEGSFGCACKDGFEWDSGGFNCTDTNECDGFTPPCDNNAGCQNIVGSYTCTCNDGYTGDGHVCTDIDECQQTPSPCGDNSDCTNTEGSYTCTSTGTEVVTTGPVATITTTASTTTTPRPPQPPEIGWTVGDSIVNSDWSAGSAGDDITGDCDDQPGNTPWPDSSSFPFSINNAQCGNSSQVGQAITNEASYNGSQSWHYKRGRGGVLTGGSGTPFSPGLETKVGRSDGDYEGEADSFYASFWFKAVKEADPFTGGDKSRIMVAAGNPNGTAPASNYLEIYYEQNRRKLVQVRTRESSPSYAQCSATRDCGDDFGFTYTIVATNLDPTEWHHVEMTLRTSTVDYQDDWYYVVDGVASSETHGAYFKTQQYDEGRYEYVNRLNIAVQHVPSVSREGFYIDDIYYKAFNWAQPDVTIDEYSTSFEEEME